jgi:hypothetical protein
VIEAAAAYVIVDCVTGWDVFVVETAWQLDNRNVAMSSLQFASTSCTSSVYILVTAERRFFHLRHGRFATVECRRNRVLVCGDIYRFSFRNSASVPDGHRLASQENVQTKKWHSHCWNYYRRMFT